MAIHCIKFPAPHNKNQVDYFNRKQQYSMNRQAAAGGYLIFLSIATGYPGSLHDSRVLRN